MARPGTTPHSAMGPHDVRRDFTLHRDTRFDDQGFQNKSFYNATAGTLVRARAHACERVRVRVRG
jgi:hypothetical protein